MKSGNPEKKSTREQMESVIRRMKWVEIGLYSVLFILAFICFVNVVGFAIGIGPALEAMYSAPPGPWHECAFEFVNGSGRVVFMRRSLPGIHAEYERKLHLEMTGQDPKFRSLYVDTGGGSEIRVYLSTDKASDESTKVHLILRHAQGEDSVILGDVERLSWSFSQTDLTQETYLGNFVGGNRFMANDELKGTPLEVVQVEDACGIIAATAISVDQ